MRHFHIILSVAVVAVMLSTTVSAHICLTYPMMRGPKKPSLYPGDDLCFQRTPDCGALVKGAPTATFVAGTPTSVQFQQNLNHWYQARPGHFDVAISYDDEKTWDVIGSLSDFPANNMNTQTYFNVPVVFPKPAASAVLRARYVSNNPNEVSPANNTDAIFYSCSDIEIVAPGNWATGMLKAAMKTTPQTSQMKAKVHVSRPTTVENVVGESCVTPNRFASGGVEYDFQGNQILSHEISYDTIASMIRWKRSNKYLGGSYEMTDYWNLTLQPAGYTPQYIVGLKGDGSCSMYGGDVFFPWQYGPQNGMAWRKNETKGNENIMHFDIASNGMRLSASILAGNTGCLPKGWSMGQNRVELISTEMSSFPAGTFTLPSSCGQKRPDAGCWAHRLH